jgi:cytochrome P450
MRICSVLIILIAAIKSLSCFAKDFPGPNLKDTLLKFTPLMQSDPRQALESLWEQYQTPEGLPIHINFPGLYNIFFVYHPKDIVEIRKSENENILKKGYTINYIKKYLLGEAMAAQETNEKYTQLHRLFFSSFTLKNIMKNNTTISRIANDFFVFLKQKSYTNKKLDLQSHIKSFSMSVISKTMLNFDLNFDEGIRINKSINNIVDFISYKQLYAPLTTPFWLPTQYNIDYKKSLSSIYKFCDTVILHDKILADSLYDNKNDTLIRKLISSIKDHKTLRDQIINIFFGGHETTSHWMTMALYHLETSKDIKAEIIEEIKDVAIDKIKDHKLPILSSFIKEVLRLNSPIEMYGRDSNQEITLRGKKIPKGSLIISTQYAAHRYDESWTNPNEFEPKRFNPQYQHLYKKEANRHIRSFFPFGFGKRSCMGRFLAELEVKIFLITYLRQKHIKIDLAQTPKPKKEIVCTSRLKEGLIVNIEPTENKINLKQ